MRNGARFRITDGDKALKGLYEDMANVTVNQSERERSRRFDSAGPLKLGAVLFGLVAWQGSFPPGGSRRALRCR